MPDPSILLYLAMGAGFGVISFILFLMAAFENGLFAAPALACLIAIPFVVVEYKESTKFAEAVRSMGADTPKREMTGREVMRFGSDAVGGIVFGAANAKVRVYCVNYFDGSRASAIPGDGFGPWEFLEDLGPCAET